MLLFCLSISSVSFSISYSIWTRFLKHLKYAKYPLTKRNFENQRWIFDTPFFACFKLQNPPLLRRFFNISCGKLTGMYRMYYIRLRQISGGSGATHHLNPLVHMLVPLCNQFYSPLRRTFL